MSVLNPGLYQALRTKFGEAPGIVNEGEEGVFSCPPTKMHRMPGRKKRKYAHIESWGETYKMNCPVCGDSRERLFISHLYGGYTTPKTSKTRYYFGDVYKCHNESCDLREHLNDLHIDRNAKVETLPSKFTRIVRFDAAEIPKNCPPIDSVDVPEHITDYLISRGFDPTELSNNYFVKYVPEGTTYMDGEEEKEFFDERLLIPIIQGRVMVSWQARRAKDLHKDKYKYLNEPSCKKATYLYNMDRALFHKRIVIVEGVTDVWRLGDNAIAIFGKKPSKTQRDMMKTLWGFNGQAVLCMDPDVDTKERDDIIGLLREARAFPGGVAELRLTGGDPAEYEYSELTEMIEEAFSRCR